MACGRAHRAGRSASGARTAAAALLTGMLVWCAPPLCARAVDRSAGADVAKPADAGAPWTRRAKKRLARDIDALLDDSPALRGAHVGLLALDARSGGVLYARNAGAAFVPASTMKLLTGSAALALLGPAFRFHTEALVAPPSATLFVRAGGDPLLSAADVLALGRAARRSGALRFPYHAVIDESAYDRTPYPPGWSWDDLVYDYAAPLSPIPVDENAAQLSASPGAVAGAPLVVVQLRPADLGDTALPPVVCSGPLAVAGVRSGITAPAGSEPDIDAVAVPATGCVAITGSLPAGGGAQSLGVAQPQPQAVFAALVAAAWPPAVGRGSPAGIAIAAVASAPAPVPAGARLVWTHDGEPLTDVLADMWWPSDNFIAEMLLRAIGRQQAGTPGTTAHGAAAERDWLAGLGVDPAPITVADGSGLSSYDRLTPAVLCAVLQRDWTGPFRDRVLDDLPIAGVRGTLATRFIGSLAERRTFAKTGSMNHTRALAGYLATIRHGAVTFAWLVDDWPGTDAGLDALRAAVLSRFIGD